MHSYIFYRRVHRVFRIAVDDGTLHLLDQVRNGDTSWAGIGAVEDREAAPDAITLAQDRHALGGSLVAAIEDDAVRVDDRRGTDPVGIAPDRRAGAGAGTAENTFRPLVVDLALGGTLQALGPRLVVIVDQVGLV